MPTPTPARLLGLAALTGAVVLGSAGCSTTTSTETAPATTTSVSTATPSEVASATPTTATTPLETPTPDTSSIGPSQAAPSPTTTAVATSTTATPTAVATSARPSATPTTGSTAVTTRRIVLPDSFSGWTKVEAGTSGFWQTAGYSSDRGVIGVRARSGSLANPAEVAATVAGGKVVPGTTCAQGPKLRACASGADGLLLVVSSATLETEELGPLLTQLSAAVK